MVWDLRGLHIMSALLGYMQGDVTSRIGGPSLSLEESPSSMLLASCAAEPSASDRSSCRSSSGSCVAAAESFPVLCFFLGGIICGAIDDPDGGKDGTFIRRLLWLQGKINKRGKAGFLKISGTINHPCDVGKRDYRVRATNDRSQL